MKPYEKAIEEFTSKWMNKPEVIGIIVCGSYITGNPSKHSDIDMQIILSKDAKYRVRGNEYINDILIEYMVNPINYLETYFKKDIDCNTTIASHMLATGKIIYKTSNQINKLQQKAKANLKKKFKKTTKLENESNKYQIWDMRDNLEEIFENKGEEFFFTLHTSLEKMYQYYAKYLQAHIHQAHKIYRFMTDKKDQKKYLLEDFPDKQFVKLFCKIIKSNSKKESLSEYQKLTEHVLKKRGGFDIDGWKLRSKI